MTRGAILVVVVSLWLLVGCALIPNPSQIQRHFYYDGFVGKPSSDVIGEFGPPNAGEKIGDALYATYYLPMENGSSRKVVFVVDQNDVVTKVNYWPK